MNLHPLLARFDSIAEAAGSIQRLRKLVIVLAVNGRLAGNQKDQSSEGATLAKLLPEKHVPRPEKRRGSLEPAAIEEIELPSGFTSTEGFVRLATVAMLEKGATAIQRARPGNYPLVTTAEARSTCDHFDFSGPAAIIPMVSSTGHGNAALKRLHYQEGQFALGSILCAVLPISEGLITARFIFEYLSAFKDELLVSRMTGTANVTLTIGRIGEIPIPIIPVDIQRAVDGLMRLCDRLEAAQLERESRRVRLTAATHHKLNNGVDADALRCNAQFLVGNLPTLTTTADQIKQLRQTILSLAVRGQLSATSLPKDQTMTLGDVAALQNGYAFKSEWFVGSGVRLLRNANVSHGVIRWDDVARLPEKQASEFERFRLKEGDIVLSLDRPFIVTGTKVARVRSVDLPCLLLQRVGRFEVDPVRLCSNYLFIWLRSQAFSGQVDAGRSNGVPHISSKQVESAKLWLPSLTEQQHIVAKVDELMTLCDQLEARLSTAQAEASQLLESVVHNALIGPAEPHPWQSSA